MAELLWDYLMVLKHATKKFTYFHSLWNSRIASINHRKTVERSLAFAQRYLEIKQNELNLIFHTRKCLLYCKDIPWIKKEGNREFDVTMGSNDVAETCEFVGFFYYILLEKTIMVTRTIKLGKSWLKSFRHMVWN